MKFLEMSISAILAALILWGIAAAYSVAHSIFFGITKHPRIMSAITVAALVALTLYINENLF